MAEAEANVAPCCRSLVKRDAEQDKALCGGQGTLTGRPGSSLRDDVCEGTRRPETRGNALSPAHIHTPSRLQKIKAKETKE